MNNTLKANKEVGGKFIPILLSNLLLVAFFFFSVCVDDGGF